MAKPGSLPIWNTDNVNNTPPSLGEKQLGWVHEMAPPSNWLNWWQNNVYLWCAYLNGLEVEALTWTAIQTFTNTLNSQGGLVVSTSIANTVPASFVGNGTAYGALFTGGATNGPGSKHVGVGTGCGLWGVGAGAASLTPDGEGGLFVGGATNKAGSRNVGNGTGAGVLGLGAGSVATAFAGEGGQFKGASAGGVGSRHYGVGANSGLLAFGGSTDGYGAQVQGGGNGIGLQAVASGTEPIGVESSGAVQLGVAGGGEPTGAKQKNSITHKNIVKAQVVVQNTGSGSFSTWESYGVSGVSHQAAGGVLRVTFDNAMANDDYEVHLTPQQGSTDPFVMMVDSKNTAYVDVRMVQWNPGTQQFDAILWNAAPAGIPVAVTVYGTQA